MANMSFAIYQPRPGIGSKLAGRDLTFFRGILDLTSRAARGSSDNEKLPVVFSGRKPRLG